MAETWHEAMKETLGGLSAAVGSGQGGAAELKVLRELKDPPTGPSGLCKAHAAVWLSLRTQLASEAEPSKASRRAWLAGWLTRHERVVAGVANCPGCERPAPAPQSREGSHEHAPGGRGGGRRRGGPPRR